VTSVKLTDYLVMRNVYLPQEYTATLLTCETNILTVHT